MLSAARQLKEYAMVKLTIGLMVAVIIGIGCRWFGIPLPGPPAIMGAAMAVAMASGYTATDYLLSRRQTAVATVATIGVQERQIASANSNTQLVGDRSGVK